MLNQQTLRKKLISTHNIKHITEAIELVSSVKLQKLLGKIEHFRFYAAHLIDIVENLTQVLDVQSHPYFDVREAKKIGVVVVSSDKGLCGSYNSNLLKYADQFLLQKSDLQPQLFLFGQKSVDYFSKRAYTILSKQVSYVSKIDELHVKEWCQEFTKAFEKKELDEVWVIYTHYKNILVRETKAEKILPMQKDHLTDVTVLETSKEPIKHTHSDYIFEPNAEEIYQKIIPYALCTKVQSILLESQASELSARVVSMKAATTNAEEMIKKLTLIKNKIRQFGITKEILEINAGAEGIS